MFDVENSFPYTHFLHFPPIIIIKKSSLYLSVISSKSVNRIDILAHVSRNAMLMWVGEIMYGEIEILCRWTQPEQKQTFLI